MTVAGQEIQAVTFGLGQEVFAVPVTLVREILDYKEPFRVPNGPDYFLGLTSVRGQGVPTVDFRVRLGLPRAEPTLATSILILDIPLADRSLTLGIVIDRVFGVATYDMSRVDDAPDIGVRWRSDYIMGVVREAEGFVVIVDVGAIFAGDEPGLLSSPVTKAA